LTLINCRSFRVWKLRSWRSYLWAKNVHQLSVRHFYRAKSSRDKKSERALSLSAHHCPPWRCYRCRRCRKCRRCHRCHYDVYSDVGVTGCRSHLSRIGRRAPRKIGGNLARLDGAPICRRQGIDGWYGAQTTRKRVFVAVDWRSRLRGFHIGIIVSKRGCGERRDSVVEFVS
jgi:hypothetical protein